MNRRKSIWLAGIVLTAVLVGWFGNSLAAADPALPGSDQDPLVSKSYVDGKFKMAVVEIPAGQKLIGSAGTEIIVRGGSATVIDTPQGGLSDVTEGRDLRMAEAAPANHLLIVPRDDGRGILAVTSLFVMVRGNYIVE